MSNNMRKGFGQIAEDNLQQELLKRLSKFRNAEKHSHNNLEISICLKNRTWSQSLELLAELYKSKPLSLIDSELSQLSNYALQLAEGKKYQEALEIFVRLAAYNEHDKRNWLNFAIVLRYSNEIVESKSILELYLDTNPDCDIGLNSYGILLTCLGSHDEARAAFHRAIVINPKNAEAYSNLANEYHLLRDIDLAYIYGARAIELNSQNYELLLDHYLYLRRACDFERLELINWFALAKLADSSHLVGVFLPLLSCVTTKEEIVTFKSLAMHWGNSQASTLPLFPHDSKLSDSHIQNNSSSINIGFVSGDFRDHSVAKFILPIFEFSDSSRFSYTCFSTDKRSDDITDKFMRLSAKFIDIQSMNMQMFAHTVRENSIDILIDITGFTYGSRTQYFSKHIAPLQIAWLGFPGTTGLSTIDYIFSDKYLAPTFEDATVEKMLLTEGSSLCFPTLPELPITKILPKEKRGYTTYGSLNNPYKFTKEIVDLWSIILNQDHGSKMFLVRSEYESFYLRKNILARFAKNNIHSDRICFFNNYKGGKYYLSCYNEFDISLDTFPLTGGTTTVDCLWMGVPVITIEGEAIHQRISSSICRHVGLTEFVALNVSQYVQKVLELSQDLEKLKLLRRNIRPQIKSSLLFDQAAFVNGFENAMNMAYNDLIKS